MKRILLIILIIVVFFLVAKDFVIKMGVENGVRIVTGLPMSMKSLNIRLLKTNIEIKDLKIYNPRSFEERIMLDMPEIFIDYNLGDILKQNIHLESVVIKLNEFNVVNNKAGELNLDALKIGGESQEDKKKAKPKKEAPKKKGKPVKFQLDNLDLAVGTISFIDYSKGATPKVNDFKIDINEHYEDISNPALVIGIIVQKALLKASLAGVTGFDLGGIQGSLSSSIGDVSKLTSQTLGAATQQAEKALSTVTDSMGNLSASTDKMKDMSGDTLGSAKNLAADTADKLKETASSLKGLTGKLPFGSKDE